MGARFELRPGEIHALVGENGAGKSTLIKVITGVHPPDAGQIFFRGHPVVIGSPLAAQRLGIAAIYQEATLFPDLDIAENIYMGHYLVDGTLTPAASEAFNAGRMGSFEVVDAGGGNLVVYQGPPFQFNADNIDEWADVF